MPPIETRVGCPSMPRRCIRSIRPRRGSTRVPRRAFSNRFSATGPASFTATDIGDARLQRRFTSVRQMVEEHEEVRIWGGIHFRNSLVVGESMGRKIADHLVANYLKPTR